MAESTLAEQTLLKSYLRLHPHDAAGALEKASFDEIVTFLQEIPDAQRIAFLEELNPEIGAKLLARDEPEKSRKALELLDAARSAVLISRMDEDDQNRLLETVPDGQAKEIRTLMSYPVGSAGQIMDPRVLIFRPGNTIGETEQRLRESGRENVRDIYLVDEKGLLCGAVPIYTLVTAREEESLQAVARLPISVNAIASQEEVAETMERHNLVTMPVVDFEGRILGVIRHRALVNALEREATADMQSMVGASREERALSTVAFAVGKRLPWLQINLLTAFLAASVVGLFEATIAKFTALAVLLPVVAGQSGNTGSQALAVTIRGLALREIGLRHWPRVCMKEALVGAINGFAVALVTSLGVYLWSRSFGLSLVIGIAMVLSMSIAGVTGAIIPIALSGLGQDPAQSSSIVLTTVTDVTGFLSFLGLATLMSGLL
jgi:magnesium transporter